MNSIAADAARQPDYDWLFAGPSMLTVDAICISVGISPDYEKLSQGLREMLRYLYPETALRKFLRRYESRIEEPLLTELLTRASICERWACVNEHGSLPTYTDQLLSNLGAHGSYGGTFSDTWVRPSDFAVFCIGKSWDIPVELRRLADSAAGTISKPQGHWPWGAYETALLRNLAAAAHKFWSNYDPDDPTTAPTSADVIEYLEGRGVSNRVAEAIAQILRADGLRPGPRTKP